jgi:hypothetical protein
MCASCVRAYAWGNLDNLSYLFASTVPGEGRCPKRSMWEDVAKINTPWPWPWPWPWEGWDWLFIFLQDALPTWISIPWPRPWGLDHGHGPGHGVFILATYPEGKWITNPNPLSPICNLLVQRVFVILLVQRVFVILLVQRVFVILVGSASLCYPCWFSESLLSLLVQRVFLMTVWPWPYPFGSQ